MMKFFAPNSKPNNDKAWLDNLRTLALSYLNGMEFHRASGRELAKWLGLSPRALRSVLIRMGGFQVEYRRVKVNNGTSRSWYIDEAWYFMDEQLIQKQELPKLVRAALPMSQRVPRLETRAQSVVERFTDKEPVRNGEER